MIYIIIMHEKNIKKLDLNLLVALKALLEERHISRAAQKIDLSQPAMSRALERLRLVLDDALLVKSRRGYDLTPRANNIYPLLKNILLEVQQIITPAEFHPETTQAEIVIATRDYESTIILPTLLSVISQAAPFLKFRIIPLIGDPVSLLDNQEADLILSGTDHTASTICRNHLLTDNFTCLVAANNPLTQKQLTLKKFVNLKHCLVTITGSGPSPVDELLAERQLTRNLVVKVPHFLSAVYLVSASDLIITLPTQLALLMSQNKQIKLLRPPLSIPTFSIYMYWHIRNQNNPVHQWVRKMARKYRLTTTTECTP